ncbi:MAG: elongation factor G [Candidatus Alcyoniella australis]|nr:elongation factor G [Candidatus Alcyoniella australis]
MKSHDPRLIRNIGLFGHGGSGKTSLAEAMFFNAKMLTRLGKITDKNTVMDWEPEEMDRQVSLGMAVGYIKHGKTLINLIDTPGDANYVPDARNAMSAIDMALMVICSASGIEVQTERYWELAVEQKKPRALYINKLDRERANFDAVLEEIKQTFKVIPVPLVVPIGQEDAFEGVVDVLLGKAYRYAKDGSGKCEEIPIPETMTDRIEELRMQAIESIAESDDELMERYLEDQELQPEELVAALGKGLSQGSIVPLLSGSATLNIGVDLLLNFIEGSGPSPLDVPPLQAHDVSDVEKLIEVVPATDGAFAGLVFKTIVDPFAGKLNLLRVFRGGLSANAEARNATREANERIGQPLKMQGKKQEPVDDIVCGDIVALAKQRDTRTGDTYVDAKAPLIFDMIKIPDGSLSFAIEPKTKGDEDKIASALQRIQEEDPSLHTRRDAQTKQLILTGMGQGHLEMTIERIRRKFGVEVLLKAPKVPYKETIRASVKEVRGRYKKQTGGRGQFGDTVINLDPLPSGSGFQFVDKIVGGSIPRQYIPAVEKGISEAAERGHLAGYPVIDFQVQLVDGSYHTVDSSEMAFKIAGSMGFQTAMQKAQPTLLEPIVDMEITVPEDKTGDVMGDMNSRRGRVLGIDSKGRNSVVRVQVPLAEVLRYEPDLRSLTSGKGCYVSSFSRYEEVPHNLQAKIIEESKRESEE